MLNQQDARLGQKVGKYRLVCKLGGGGFGTVYLAENQRERMQVAVKVLHLPQMSDEDLKGFINETRMIGLHHPHIMPLLDFGISRNGLPFLVMEYAPEGTLRDRHPKGERIALPLIVSYVDQIASALQYAHDRQIIHRDVKPENILVHADGTLLVSDFGVAKFLEQSVQISRQTQVGTPMYMAPELHMGYPCFASDQYALAVAIYEWICGDRPFQGTALGLTVQHMNTPPPRLRDHLPELAEEVEHVILKALAKAPEDRFERIEEMASALRSAAQLPMIHNLTIERDKRVPLILPEQVSQPAAKEKLEALANDRTEVVPVKPAIRTGDLPLPKRSIPGFSLALLRARGRKHRPSKRFPLLIGGALGFTSLLIALILILKPMVFLQGGSSATPITPQKTPTQQKQMAEKWNFLTNGRINTAPIMASDTLYVNSSSENGSKVYAIDTKSGRQKWVFPLDSSEIFSSTVQSEMLYIGVSDKVYAIDTKSGRQKWVFPFDGYNVFPSPTVQDVYSGILYIAAFSPNNRPSGKMYAIDTKTGDNIWTFPIDGSLVYLLTVQNGTLYVGASSPGFGGNVYAIDTKTGLQKWVFPLDGSGAFSLTVQNGIVYVGASSPNSGGNVYAIDTKTGYETWTFPIDGNADSELLVQDGVLYVGAFSLDHTNGEVSNSEVYARDAETGHKIWTFSSDGNDGSELLVQDGVLYIGSASSSYSQASSKEGKVDAVDTKNGQEIWAFPITGAVLFSLAAQSGTLYIGLNPYFLSNSNPKIYAIDIKTGQMKWSFPTGGSFFSLSTAINGELYAGSFDGSVYAWTLPAPPSHASR